MKRASRYFVRLAAGVVLFLALGGPTPGNVGGCGSSTPVANPRQFCVDFEFWKCRREQFARRIDEPTAQACFAAIDAACSGRNAWVPSTCAPTPAEAQACIAMLQQADLASIPTTELLATRTECNLCM